MSQSTKPNQHILRRKKTPPSQLTYHHLPQQHCQDYPSMARMHSHQLQALMGILWDIIEAIYEPNAGIAFALRKKASLSLSSSHVHGCRELHQTELSFTSARHIKYTQTFITSRLMKPTVQLLFHADRHAFALRFGKPPPIPSKGCSPQTTLDVPTKRFVNAYLP
jgi:hypothetical protein